MTYKYVMTGIYSTGIYSIQNIVNGKQYIGSALSCQKRWREHKDALLRGDHHSRVLQRAWNKYGHIAFQFRKLLVCSSENLLMYEQICIDGLRPAYNRDCGMPKNAHPRSPPNGHP